MKNNYSDIYSRVDGEPDWFDLNGCPRYGRIQLPIHLMGNIKCQYCKRKFRVALADPVYKLGSNIIELSKSYDHRGYTHLKLADKWSYGDPPRHGCIGDTMTSISSWEYNFNKRKEKKL